MIKVIAIVGKSKSGKTTLIERLIKVLSSRGLRIATVKHTFHKLNIDIPGKDTWRHIKAGSKATALSTPDALMIIKPTAVKDNLDHLIKMFNDYDLLLVEGFKESKLPKIIVQRSDDESLISNLANVIAVATNIPLKTDLKQLSLDDINGIADFIEKFIK
jgi:molybdopterin-guanine dinucleotide biosynthesis protein B